MDLLPGTVTCFSHKLLPAIRHVSSDFFIFQQKKCLAYRAHCFHTVIFHKVVERHIQGVVGSVMMSLLQISC